jgi:hypothetical protein
MPKPVTNPRIVKLIELEAAGRIKPEHQAELDAYRNRGLAPKPDSDDESERTAAFLATRVAGGIEDLGRVPKGSEKPTVAGEVAGWFGAGARNYVNDEDRQRVEAAQKDILDAALTLGTGAAYSPEQLDGYRESYFPQLNDEPGTVADKERRLKRLLESARIKAGGAGDAIDRALATSSAPTSPSPLPPTGVGAMPASAKASADGSGTFSTPKDMEFNTAAQALFAKGGTREDFDRLSLQYGAAPFGDDLDKAIANRSVKGVTAFAPPMSGATGPSILGAAAATPGGAAVTGSLNALTGGTLDEIVGLTGGSQQQAQLAKEVMANDHPYAYAGGEIGGAIVGSLTAGGLAARALPSLGAGAASLVGDMGYGAGFGAGENNDNRLVGAAQGALGAAAGNIGGQAVVRGVAGAIAPNVSEGVRFLRDNGVRTTPGQSLGPTASRYEEKLVSLPIIGDLVRNGRQRALTDFNLGVMNDSLGRIGTQIPDGVEGTAAMAHGQQAFDNAYDAARSQMQLVPDVQMATDLTDLSTRVANGELSEASANRLGTIYQAEVMRRLNTNGPVSGDTYKTISSRLGALQRTTRATDPELSGALREMQGIIDQTARRSSPPEAAAAMDAADEGYALWTRVENAAKMRGGDTGSFTPAQLDSAVQRGDGSVRSRAYLRGDALGQDWATHGKNILRDVVPNSGTADRLATGGVLSGIGYMAPQTAIPAALATGAYVPGVRDVLSSVIGGARPAAFGTVADVLRDRAFLGGAAGTALTLDALARR